MGIAFEKAPKHIQEEAMRQNPGVFNRVGAVETNKPKPAVASALDSCGSQFQSSDQGVAICVVFVASIFKPMDDDNLVGSLKPLRDSVSRQIGIDDGDPRISFQYHQIKAARKSDEGVMVFIKAVQTINQIKP